MGRKNNAMSKSRALRLTRIAIGEGWERLDLSSQGLTVLPPEIGQLSQLATLIVERNQLNKLPPEIGLGVAAKSRNG